MPSYIHTMVYFAPTNRANQGLYPKAGISKKGGKED
jgi:hypothetical protein